MNEKYDLARMRREIQEDATISALKNKPQQLTQREIQLMMVQQKKKTPESKP